MTITLAVAAAVLFLAALGVLVAVDTALTALFGHQAPGRHETGAHTVAELRHRCQADSLPYYPQPTAGTGREVPPVPAVPHHQEEASWPS